MSTEPAKNSMNIGYFLAKDLEFSAIFVSTLSFSFSLLKGKLSVAEKRIRETIITEKGIISGPYLSVPFPKMKERTAKPIEPIPLAKP